MHFNETINYRMCFIKTKGCFFLKQSVTSCSISTDARMDEGFLQKKAQVNFSCNLEEE